jgi:general L-amino acid transport system permease protein
MLQLLLIAALVIGFCFLAENAVRNLTSRHIPFGFGFLFQSAGFDIEQSLIDYNPLDTVSRVILVGLTNTVVAAVSSIMCASVLGLIIALLRLSPNLLFRLTGAAYVGLIRNIPLLLLVFFWYSAVLRLLPPPRASWTIGTSVFLNVRGLYLPRPIVANAGTFWLGLLILVAGITVLLIARPHLWVWSRRAVLTICFGALLFILGTVARQVQVGFEYPQLAGFNFRGGLHLFPEFVALVAALSVGEAAFIAEIIRAGVLSVSRGQTEAARALGMSRLQIIRKIVFPQALPVIVPPLTSEYLSLTKATSLGVAIAFPDLVQVFAGIVLSRVGHEIEVMLMTMSIYLSLSLLTAAFMNWYNRRVKLVEG